MIRIIVLVSLLATSAFADKNKEESCGYQADVVAAIQKARLARVKEDNVGLVILADNPSWPENFNAAIPYITPWVYEKKMRIVRKKDLAAAWKELCLQQ